MVQLFITIGPEKEYPKLVLEFWGLSLNKFARWKFRNFNIQNVALIFCHCWDDVICISVSISGGDELEAGRWWRYYKRRLLLGFPVRFQLIEGGSHLPSEFASRATGQAVLHWLCLQDLWKRNHRQKGYNSEWLWILAPLFWHTSSTQLLVCTEYTTHKTGRLSSCRIGQSFSWFDDGGLDHLFKDRIVANLQRPQSLRGAATGFTFDSYCRVSPWLYTCQRGAVKVLGSIMHRIWFYELACSCKMELMLCEFRLQWLVFGFFSQRLIDWIMVWVRVAEHWFLGNSWTVSLVDSA